MEHLLRILPFSFWVHRLSADSTDSPISLTLFFYFKHALLEDFFSVSPLTILCVEWHLCCPRFFFSFSSQSVQICSEICSHVIRPDSYAEFFVHSFIRLFVCLDLQDKSCWQLMFLHSHRNLHLSAD